MFDDRVDGVPTRAGESQCGRSESEHGGVLEATLLCEESAGAVHVGGRDHRCRARCCCHAGARAECDESACGLADARGYGRGLGRLEAHVLHARSRAVDSGAAEPAEQLLGAVREQGGTHGDAQGQQTGVERARVVCCLRHYS